MASSRAWAKRNARLEAADEGDDVAPVTLQIQIQRCEEIDFRARRKHRAKVEAVRQDANDGDRRPVQFDGLADDGWIGGELAPPISVGQQSDRMRRRLEPRLR